MTRRSSLLALLAGALLIACVGRGADSLTSTPTPTPTSTEAAPTAEEIAALQAEMDQILQTVAELVGIDAGTPPAVTLLTTETLTDLLDRLLAEPESVDYLARDQQLLGVMGLIPREISLEEITREYFIAGVAGLYNPDDRALYVRLFGRFSAMEEVTAAHEYHHYLQDRAYGIERMQAAAEGDRDRELALTALIEGDASHVQTLYMTEQLTPAEIMAMGFGGAFTSTPRNTPLVMLRETTFSYITGAEFIATVFDAGLTRDELFARPPVTTEQILHPSKYLEGEAGVEVTFEVDEGSLPAGWTLSPEVGLGEFLLRTWLEERGAPFSAARDAAAGWGGDTAHMVLEDGRAVGLVARIEWDLPADGSEFVEAASAALSLDPDLRSCGGCSLPVWEGPLTVAVAEREPGVTLLVLALDPADLDSLLALTGASR